MTSISGNNPNSSVNSASNVTTVSSNPFKDSDVAKPGSFTDLASVARTSVKIAASTAD